MELEDLITEILRILFPSARAFTNFMLIWAFLLVMSFNISKPLIVLVSALGIISCYNEWAKENGFQKKMV